MRRPIFWFLWPPASSGPLDDAASQRRWDRVCPRGPWRLAMLIGCTAILITVVPAVVLALLAAPGAAAVIVTLVVAIPAVSLLARAWVAGTYVSDRGIKVSTVLATQAVPWTQATAVEREPGSRLLGLPVTVAGERVVVTTPIGTVRTHVETASSDLWLRPDAYEAARDRLTTWWRETR